MLDFIANSIIGPVLPLFLLFAGLFMNIRLKFLPFTKSKVILSSVLQKNPSNTVSPLKALCVALAGTLGVGNIVGVAVAIRAGGAGALFWMWISAVFSMVLKFGETVLALCHRKEISPDGTIMDHSFKNKKLSSCQQLVGGAMYYIKSKPVAVFFALLCLASSFTVGNLLQSNALGESFENVFSIPPWITGTVLAILTFIVIIKGIERISSFCAFVVPFLSLIYIMMSLIILFQNATELPAVFGKIINSAFSLQAVGGGVGGSVMIHAMRVGFARGLITNEAGCGTAPIAHATAQTDSPVRQGFLGIIEVFFDTIILCTMTGLVILLSIDKFPTLNGIALVNAAFSETFGGAAGILLAISIFLFVIATLVGWSFYGKTALEFFSRKKIYGVVYCILFSVTALLGTLGAPDLMWTLSDITCGLMTFLNTGALLVMHKEVKEETDAYFRTHKTLSQ